MFIWRGCRDPEAHADETINRIIRKIDEGEEIRDLISYAHGVARRLLLEIFKRQEREQIGIEELPPLVAPPEQRDEGENGVRCLRRCLNRLPEESRQLIVQYYQGEKNAKIENRNSTGKMASAITRSQSSLPKRRVTAMAPRRHSIIWAPRITTCRIMTERSSVLNGLCGTGARSEYDNRAPGEYQLAMECFEQALQLSRGNRDSSSEARILAGMAEAHEALDQFELARKEIDQAVAIVEKIRTEIISPEHRILSQPWLTMFYRIQAHTLMWLHQKDPAAGYDELALGTSEQSRLRNLIELLSGLKIELSQGIDAEDLTRLRELQLKLETVETRRAQSLSRKRTEKLASLDREIEELQASRRSGNQSHRAARSGITRFTRPVS